MKKITTLTFPYHSDFITSIVTSIGYLYACFAITRDTTKYIDLLFRRKWLFSSRDPHDQVYIMIQERLSVSFIFAASVIYRARISWILQKQTLRGCNSRCAGSHFRRNLRCPDKDVPLPLVHSQKALSSCICEQSPRPHLARGASFNVDARARLSVSVIARTSLYDALACNLQHARSACARDKKWCAQITKHAEKYRLILGTRDQADLVFYGRGSRRVFCTYDFSRDRCIIYRIIISCYKENLRT